MSAQAAARYRQVVAWLDAANVFAGSWPRRVIDAVGRTLNGVATLAAATGQAERAARLFAAAAADHDAIGSKPALPERTLFEQATTSVRERLGADDFEAAWTAGAVMTPAEARADVEAILALSEPRPALPADPVAALSLTARELEVLRLLADKLSDKEIGAALYVSHRTAMGHVANIFRKLGVSSRADAVQQARDLGLL